MIWLQYEVSTWDKERWKAIREGWLGNSSLPDDRESRLHKDRHVIEPPQNRPQNRARMPLNLMRSQNWLYKLIYMVRKDK